MDASPPLPAWVRKRDGRTEPFDADKINRALYAALERQGQPDAFVARELTDSVLHFLAGDHDDGTVASAQIAETLVKVVRELGQPQVALAYAERKQEKPAPASSSPTPPPLGPSGVQIQSWIDTGMTPLELLHAAGSTALQAFTPEAIYPRHLTAAHEDGLLSLEDFEWPRELAGAVVRPYPALGAPVARPLVLLEQARNYLGGMVALDSPEYELAQQRGDLEAAAAALLGDLGLAARLLHLHVVLNVGSSSGPSWTTSLAPGPLFSAPDNVEAIAAARAALVKHALEVPASTRFCLDWHLTAQDFAEENPRHLLQLVQAAVEGSIRFVCDRPRRDIALAEGLDRQHAALLGWVQVSLPALLERLGSSIAPETFLNKLMSLVRLAASAGVHKRAYLRQHQRPEWPTFLLDRAHLGVHIHGLDEVLSEFFGAQSWEHGEAMLFAQVLLQRLQQTLEEEARRIHVPCLLDDHPDHPFAVWHEDARMQLRTAGRLHGVAGRGTVLVLLEKPEQTDSLALLELLHFAWKHTSIQRLWFHRTDEPLQQLTTDAQT